ncbi:helix-turn-helix domain-containing protein [Pseudonocardia sp. Cha107L01]|uniref:helix-turn-helix domain-containing protein n=1 Tax=Pseudonocardia sp. Cha107L01 TaxID=3457576 RepID=UPI00403E596A
MPGIRTCFMSVGQASARGGHATGWVRAAGPVRAAVTTPQGCPRGDLPTAYAAARLAFELGAAVRELRVACKWSQAELAAAAGMTQSAVARFEAGGTTPTLPV